MGNNRGPPGLTPLGNKDDTYQLTCPGRMVPTAGETISGTESGTQNSNEVGPTAAISPKHRLHSMLSLGTLPFTALKLLGG